VRRILFAGVCIFCLAPDVRADLPTIDITQAVNSIKEQLQAAKSFATQTQQYLAQLQQLSQEVQLVASLVHDPSLGTVMALAGQTGLGNSLPVNPYQMMALVNGFGGGVNGLSGALGKLNQLASLTNSISSTNHVYSPTDGSWTSQQLIAGGAGLYTTQGGALALLEDMQNHIPVLQALRDRLSTATDPKTVLDAQAQIQAEGVWTQNTIGQLNAMQVAASVQSDLRIQRDNESVTKSIDDFLTKANSYGGGISP
jgi:hypothetical protein